MTLSVFTAIIILANSSPGVNVSLQFIGLSNCLDMGWVGCWVGGVDTIQCFWINGIVLYLQKSKLVKASSYIAQYPIIRTVQSDLHFTSLTDLFTQTPSRLHWEASSHMLQLMCGGCSYTYQPPSIARY